MAWNEPGGNNRDPWGGGKQDGPPDLDEVLRNLKEKFGGLFGGAGRRGKVFLGDVIVADVAEKCPARRLRPSPL